MNAGYLPATKLFDVFDARSVCERANNPKQKKIRKISKTRATVKVLSLTWQPEALNSPCILRPCVLQYEPLPF